ncbi:MAG: amino acid permease [Chloroflexi bacterium]|nr:amino acid permease [Chloroflexota bacterium]
MATTGAASSPGIPSEKPTLFLRKASGVVKAFSPLDSFAYNVLANNPMTLGAISFLLIPWAFPGGNIPIAMFIAMIGGLFCAITYSFLQASMPRTGGDYVFQSRLLGPSIAFPFTFGAYVVANAMFIGLNGWMFCAMIFGPLFQLLGGAWQNKSLLDFAALINQPWGFFLGGMVMIAWITIMVSVPFTLYAKIQKWFFFVGGLATLGAAVVLLLMTQDGWQANLNSFMSQNFGVKDAYQTVIGNAQAAGFNPNLNFQWAATMPAVASCWFILMSSMWGAGNAGEIRDKGSVRTKFYQIAGSLFFSAGIAGLFGYLIVSRFGSQFLSSATWLFTQAPDKTPLPIAPFFSFLSMLASLNPLIIIMIWLAFFCFWWMANPNAGVYGTRVLLAMSMDRAIPAWFGKVNSKTHTPFNAMMATALLATGFNALYSFTLWFPPLTTALSFLIGVSYAVTCFAGALWPFLKPESFKASPAGKYMIGSVPVITISGLVFVAFMIFLIYYFLTVPALGINGVPGLVLGFGSFILGYLIYLVFKAYRKQKESLDLAMVYLEIPPE